MTDQKPVREPDYRAPVADRLLADAGTHAFDRLARLAVRALDVPTAYVSIVEEHRQVFVGLATRGDAAASADAAVRETPIRYSYCQYVVESCEPLVIADAHDDARLCTHPNLLERGVVAYLGVPLTMSDGRVIGAFCAIDTKPRSWTAADVEFMTDLAASVVTEIELRERLADHTRIEQLRATSEAHYRRLVRGIPQAVYVLDREGRFVELNEGAERILGRTADEMVGQSFRMIMPERGQRPVGEIFTRVITGAADDIEFEAWIARPSGEERLLVITASAIEQDGRATGLYGIARDVTDERAAQRALRESEERFRQIAANIREMFWIFTPDFGTALYLSPAYEQLFGHPVADVYADAKSFLDRVHPDDLPALLEAMQQVAHERVMGVEYRVVHVDGCVRWILARGYPVRDEQGSVVRVVGTAEDITERKAAELALRDSERRLRQVLDAMPIGAVLAEPPGRLVWHNPAADRIWGGVQPAGPEAFDHYIGYETETGREIEPIEWPLARALAGETVEGDLIDVVTFDGRRCTTLNSAVPLRNAAGEITGAIALIEDVTEARARDAEQRLLAAALEGLSEGICLVTRDGAIVYANETFTSMLGIEPDRVPVIDFAEFAGSPEDRREQLGYFHEALEHGRWSGRIVRRRLSDGVEVPIDLVLGRVEHDGASHLLFGIAQDATVEIQREQHLRRAERLASVGTMIGGVAHELNNPLQAILNFAQLLLLDERSSEDRDALGVMVREAQRMAKIVTDLKQIARSTQEETGGKGATDLNEVVRHVLKVQEYRMRTSNIEVRLDLASELPLILVDRGQLEQVVVNLVVNAEQAMTAHGTGGRLILRTRASAHGASLHVVDNGHGIPPHQLERIFDPFFTTKSPGEGTGLGLSLVHSIVTEHGGEIRVDSEVGTGTAFRLDWLRAVDYGESAAPVVAEPAPSVDTPPLRILVVDDETALRSVMARFLSRRGHTVDQAADGAAALRMMDDASYDVILSDLRMPGVGGEAMMERLRERGLADRVIFMTGDAAGAAARLADAGAPILLKPVELADVARVVESRAATP